MKQNRTVLIVLTTLITSLIMAACTLPAPGGEPPTATMPEAVEEVATAVPTEAPSPTPPPTEVPPTAEPPTAAPPTDTAIPPTQEAQPEAAQPTATQPAPTNSPTPGASFDPRTSYGEPTYENPMEFPNYWEWASAGTDTLPNNKIIRLQFKDGNLYVTGKRVNFSTWWFSGHFLNDAFIEMTYDTEDCSGDDAYGMILRGPKHGAGISYGYIVSITCDGEIAAFRLDSGDPFDVEELVDWQKPAAINTGSEAENVLGVRAEDDQFTVYVNGTEVIEFEDDHFEKGRVGVFVRAARPNAYTYRVKNFAFWEFEED